MPSPLAIALPAWHHSIRRHAADAVPFLLLLALAIASCSKDEGEKSIVDPGPDGTGDAA